jgi:gamma-glutamylcyclotransferase (GGCT)/AIG2-like uncharacterized protein YtfP
MENLFSYGTLQYEKVQLETFGRLLNGHADILPGFTKTMVKIEDEKVVATSGEAYHPIIHHTGNPADTIEGYVFEITPDELKQADNYEVDRYKRIAVSLKSGKQAWVYVQADDQEAG